MGRPLVILIDTHVWIWLNLAPENLTNAARERLNSEPRIAISTISIYETMVAAQKGRVASSLDPETLVRRWLKSTDLVRIPPSEDTMIKSRSLVFNHGDPFDRIIAGTAVTENVPLLTADRNLLKLEWLATIPAQ
jgi:PIN domain nuclease of toxin-antitoxin system